ncbi:AraC family transcriptional regulator [Candidatus Enterococcus avicola]
MVTQPYIFTPNPSEYDIDTSLKEITEHGDSLFPVSVYLTNHPADQANMIHTHWHRELEILYIFRGKMEIKVEGVSYIAKEGELVFIPANQLHEALNYQQTACTFFAIVFDATFIESRVSDLIQQSYLDPLLHSADQQAIHITSDFVSHMNIQQALTHIIDLFALKEPLYELAIKAELFLFIKYLCQNSQYINRNKKPIDSKSKLNTYKCKKILLFIEENYQRPVTLEEISQYIGYSKEHFCRFFKRNFQMSFFTYLNKFRIKKAEYLLLHTDLKIIEIALETGFDDPNYFTTLFKRETALTPSNYRKRPSNTTNL